MTQDTQLLIKIKDLHKYYGQGSARNHVLKGIDLNIEQGEFIAIVGTSGSGKTTLLNVLGALDRTYQGSVEISGLNLQQLTDRRLSQLRNEIIGFIFQSFNLLPHLSCAQNVSIPSFFRSHDLNTADIATRVRKLLSSVGLEDKYADRPTELSGGQRQRVCIARALFNEPHLILCDEPTGSLDRETGQQIIDLFRTLNRDRRITFIIVTHDENLSQSCDRIIRLADGLVLEDFKQVMKKEGTPKAPPPLSLLPPPPFPPSPPPAPLSTTSPSPPSPQHLPSSSHPGSPTPAKPPSPTTPSPSTATATHSAFTIPSSTSTAPSLASSPTAPQTPSPSSTSPSDNNPPTNTPTTPSMSPFPGKNCLFPRLAPNPPPPSSASPSAPNPFPSLTKTPSATSSPPSALPCSDKAPTNAGSNPLPPEGGNATVELDLAEPSP
jgi:putative ABC transport system ATP-binding protein